MNIAIVMQSVKKLSFALSMLFCSSLALAQQVEKDWAFAKLVDPNLGVMSCTATTSVSQSKLSVKTEIILPQGDEKAPLLLVKAKGLAGKFTRAYLRPDALNAYAMLLLNTDAETGVDTFVLSPLFIPKALDLIIKKVTLDMYFGEGKEAVLARVSLRGSSLALDRAAACRTSKQLVNKTFFTELQAGLDAVEPAEGDLEAFFTTYQSIPLLLNKRLVVEAELFTSQGQGKKLKDQLAKSEQALSAAVKSEQSAATALDNAKKRLVDLQAELTAAQSNLPVLQNQRPMLAQNVQNAQYALEPHISRVRNLENEILAEQRNLEVANNEVLNIQNSIASVEYKIRQLDSQVDALRSQEQSLRQRIRDLKAEEDRVQREYDRFDVGRRAEEIFNRTYPAEKQKLDYLVQRRQQLPGEISDAQRNQSDAERALNNCLREKEQNNKVMCGKYRDAVQNAQNHLRNKQDALRDIDSKIAHVENNISNLRRDAERQARNEKQNILDRKRQIESQISQLQHDLRDVSRRMDDIQNIEIPRHQRELSSLQSRLSSAQAQANYAAQALRQAQYNLDNYKQSVGYDQLVTNLSYANERLYTLDNSIAYTQQRLQKIPGEIASIQNQIPASEQELARRTQARINATAVVGQDQQKVSEHQVVEDEIKNRFNEAQAEVVAAKIGVQAVHKKIFDIYKGI